MAEYLYLVDVTGTPDHIDNDDLDVGELQGILNIDQKIITYWNLNDHRIRAEYISELLEYFGAEFAEPTETLYKIFQETLWRKAVEDQGLVKK